MQTIKYGFSMFVPRAVYNIAVSAFTTLLLAVIVRFSCLNGTTTAHSHAHALLRSGSLQQKSIIEIIFQQENNKYRAVAFVRFATFASPTIYSSLTLPPPPFYASHNVHSGVYFVFQSAVSLFAHA